jgi:hypothetical protein
VPDEKRIVSDNPCAPQACLRVGEQFQGCSAPVRLGHHDVRDARECNHRPGQHISSVGADGAPEHGAGAGDAGAGDGAHGAVEGNLVAERVAIAPADQVRAGDRDLAARWNVLRGDEPG